MKYTLQPIRNARLMTKEIVISKTNSNPKQVQIQT